MVSDVDSAPVLFIKGRQHKVTVHYATEPQTDYLDAALKTVFQIHTRFPPGAILVFLPGEYPLDSSSLPGEVLMQGERRCSGQDEIESLASSIKQFAPDLPNSFPKADAVRSHCFSLSLLFSVSSSFSPFPVPSEIFTLT